MPHAELKIANEAEAPDAFRTTGTSPTGGRGRGLDVHLLGPGAVGRAFLERLALTGHRLVAVTDTTATLYDAQGLNPGAISRWKSSGLSLREHPRASVLSTAAALDLSGADIIVDSSSSELGRAGWSYALDHALNRGAALAFAAKGALCESGAEWLHGEHAARVGFNAVLGGTGARFATELYELTTRCRSAAIVGNASTTAIINALEHGATLQEGIADAQRLGYLEPDPTLDLKGTDAAVKLAIVAGILGARRIDPLAIPCDDIRDIDVALVRSRARNGSTTRLVARIWPDGALRVAYEAVSGESLLAAPCGRVVYEYLLSNDERRLHIGAGLGADATGEALWSDVRDLATHYATLGAARRVATAGGAR
jgi:homoserine dehydrogenase